MLIACRTLRLVVLVRPIVSERNKIRNHFITSIVKQIAFTKRLDCIQVVIEPQTSFMKELFSSISKESATASIVDKLVTVGCVLITNLLISSFVSLTYRWILALVK